MRFLNKMLDTDPNAAEGLHGVLEQLGHEEEELLVNRREDGTK